MQARWIFRMLWALVGSSCVGRAPRTGPSCDQSRLTAAASMLRQVDLDQRAPSAAQAIVDYCELPVIEPYLRQYAGGHRTDKIQPHQPWADLREATCPGWNQARVETAYQAQEMRARHIWDTCHYEKHRLISFAKWHESGADDLPFMVFELLSQADVDASVAKTFVRALVER